MDSKPTQPTLNDAFYGVADVAVLIGSTYQMTVRYAKDGTVPFGEKYLGRWRFNKCKFDKWLATVSSGELGLNDHRFTEEIA
tara:strand:- start:1166 stop:1411 length:246 start_codon:yes stop_codon:yes gene_type:complete